MLKKGHGKPVDLWSLGVITYTLLCGYSPFRSENLGDLIEECKDSRNPVFHPRYWNEVSDDAKDFIKCLLKPDPRQRPTSSQALKHVWLTGKTAGDHNLLPEIRAYVAKARLRRGIEMVKLANRIEALKMQEDEDEGVPGAADVPANAIEAAGEKLAAHNKSKGLTVPADHQRPADGSRKRSLSRIARGAIFREVVLAKVREIKDQQERDKFVESKTN
ncbi:hypothetical protein LTS18_001831, partial [Coniosporium uncinatum]